MDNKVVPVEVRAGSTGRLRSQHVLVQSKSLSTAVRFCSEPPTVLYEQRGTTKGDIDFTPVSLPRYLAQQTSRVLNEIGIAA